jgi:histidine decarboxylase
MKPIDPYLTVLPAGEPVPASTVEQVLGGLLAFLDEDRLTNIGYPSTFDIDYRRLWPFFNRVLNNIGDPYSGATPYPANTKRLEREVVEWFANLLHAPSSDRWGYVTTGGTEGNEYGLLLGRERFPDAVTYYSAAAHYSIPKLLGKLRMPGVCVQALADGRMNLRDLASAVRARRHLPVIVLATVGTTMTEAVDDVTSIRRTLDRIPVGRVHVHADAALSGLPLGLLERGERPGFDLADGADSVCVSGHKFVGCPFPCGVVVTRATLMQRLAGAVPYIGADTTLSGSRSGHAPLVLWYALCTHGTDGLRERAVSARAVAGYAVAQIREAGWPVWRNPHALTVVLDTPPGWVRAKWSLASHGGLSHVVCLPGVTTDQIDALVKDLSSCGPRVPGAAESDTLLGRDDGAEVAEVVAS